MIPAIVFLCAVIVCTVLARPTRKTRVRVPTVEELVRADEDEDAQAARDAETQLAKRIDQKYREWREHELDRRVEEARAATPYPLAKTFKKDE